MSDDKKLNNDFAFGKKNYILVAAGTLITIIGYFLVSGGGSDDPKVFSEELRHTKAAPIQCASPSPAQLPLFKNCTLPHCTVWVSDQGRWSTSSRP